MPDKNTGYGLPAADELIKCPSCKDYIEVCDTVLVNGIKYCDICSETANAENDLCLAEEIKDSQKEEAYIRKHLEGEFEADYSEEYMDA